MPTITQDGQPFRIDTSLGSDELLLHQFTGAEGISVPFAFDVELLSENDAVSAADLLRTGAALTFHLPGGGERIVHGLIRRFAQMGQRDQLTSYRAEIVPWLWFLSLSSDIRIFQNLTVLEIVEQVFKAQGYSDFEIKCTRAYPKREYCVQYRETNLDFVSRLLEEEGIFYFFEHTSSKHTLVLADDNSSVPDCAGGGAARLSGEAVDGEDVVLSVTDDQVVRVGKVTLTDHDYLQPSLSLQQSVSGDGKEEVYDYPGLYTKPEDGDRFALIRLQEREAFAHLLTGEGTFRGFQSGSRFDLKGHYRRSVNGSYVLTSVSHSGGNGSYRAWEDRQPRYANTFTCIPSAVPFRPSRATPRPHVYGSQTAIVVGKSGEEIWVDKHGRVKVQFHWDREGGRDENSSCWVRVSSSWAGKGWGWIQIPRIGQEVVVDFLEGDPDRPIITGRLYNAEQVPPYALPDQQTQSGVKSRSSKSGGTDNFNEIRLEDLKGSEHIYVHAEKDMQEVVENDRTRSVGHDESITVGNDRTASVGNNQSVSIGANQSLTVGGNRTDSIDQDDSLNVSGNHSLSVTKNESVDVSGKRAASIAKDDSLSVGEKRSTQVGKDDQLQVGKKLVIDAGDQIVLKSGKGSITIKKDGSITIKGKDIKIDASGKINAKASSDIKLKGSKIAQN
jgi:type VI secretion system secreted protein VgrG